MDIHRVTRYDADPEAVFTMSAEATVGIAAGGAVRSELRQTLPAEVPDFVRKLTGPAVRRFVRRAAAGRIEHELNPGLGGRTWEPPGRTESAAGRAA